MIRLATLLARNPPPHPKGSRSSPAPQQLYHVTRNRRFRPDPTVRPTEGVVLSAEPQPGLYLTDNPDYWRSWAGEQREVHVAVLDVSRLTFGWYNPADVASRAAYERSSEALQALRRQESEEVFDTALQAIVDAGHPRHLALRFARELSIPAAMGGRVIDLAHDNPAVQARGREALSILVQEGLATEQGKNATMRRLHLASERIRAAQQARDLDREKIRTYDFYIPREGRYPEYFVQPDAFPRLRLIEVVPFHTAKARYFDTMSGWRTKL